MIAREQMIKKYVEMLRCGRASIFLGAGLSKPVGFFDWKELLREPAKELGLDIDKENDLIDLAQMYVLRKGNRGGLTQEILNHFGKDITGTDNHRVISRLPVSNIWTTNYDLVIEETYRQEGIHCHVVMDDDALAYSNINAPVTIYKMHGDVSKLNSIVLTRDDYEFFDTKRSAMSNAFYCALVQQTFLFLGFSFNDPNLQKIFGKIRAVFKENSREHYTVMRRPQPKDEDYRYKKNRFELFVDDLKRYNIQTVVVESYSDITNILKAIEQEYFKKNIYVSIGTGGTDLNQYNNFYGKLGKTIILEGYNLTAGLDNHFGSQVLAGALAQMYACGKCSEFYTRFNLFALPEIKKKQPLKYREDMIKRSGCCVFAGTADKSEDRNIMHEYRTAKEWGKVVIPIPLGSDGVVREIWHLEKESAEGCNNGLRQAYNLLGNQSNNCSEAEIIQAAFKIISSLILN